jgi:transposase
MTLATGTKLGPYEIVAPLGAGGMGELYRVRDTRLSRETALKILPEAFARDAERMARFQREVAPSPRICRGSEFRSGGARMRGEDQKQEAMFSYVSPEKRVPADHPLRPIRDMVDTILKEMSPRFARRYAKVGRPSIAPERLLRALLLQICNSVRSERLRMEQLDYNLLFRWFVGMPMDERVWDHAVFSKNRERLLNEEIAEAFLHAC